MVSVFVLEKKFDLLLFVVGVVMRSGDFISGVDLFLIFHRLLVDDERSHSPMGLKIMLVEARRSGTSQAANQWRSRIGCRSNTSEHWI